MEIASILDFQKKLLDLTLQFIECNDNEEAYFQELIDFLNVQKQPLKADNLHNYLQLLNRIFDNHHRSPRFFEKIEKIIIQYKSDIEQNFSSSEIFHLFENNKRLLLILFNNEILPKDESIISLILSKSYNEDRDYKMFFISECQPFDSSNFIFSKVPKEVLENYDIKRSTGENDSPLAKIIRLDLINEFIVFCNETNLPLTCQIKPSIFETNSLLINTEPTLIEYAAFFGSIQIFKYLHLNKVELTPSLWIYSIHSNNAELIQILVDEKVTPKSEDYSKCLNEAILCYHNEIAYYILENLFSNNSQDKVVEYAFQNYNYSFFPEKIDFQNDIIQICLVKYNYLDFVKILIERKEFDTNKTIKINIFMNHILNKISIKKYLNEI